MLHNSPAEGLKYCRFRAGITHRSESMPEASQYVFTHKELVEMMVKRADLHEGKWMMMVTFGFSVANGGPSPDQMIPIAVAGVQSIAIQKATADAPPSLVVDAAEVNPAEGKSNEGKDHLVLLPS